MQLTHAQEAMAAAIEDQWLASAMATGPAVRDAAEQGVRESYRQAGLPAPERIYWFGSPRAGAAAVALLSGFSAPPEAPDWFAQVRSDLLRQGWTPGETAGRSVRRQVRTEPWAAARKAAVDLLGTDGWAQLSAAAGRRSWNLVMDLVAGRLRLRLGEDLTADFPGATGRAMRAPVLDAVYGQHDGAWLSTFEATTRLSTSRPPAGPSDDHLPGGRLPGGRLPDGLPDDRLAGDGLVAGRLGTGSGPAAGLAGLAQVARHAGWWWANERVAVLTERPTQLTRDNVGRLHRGEGAAMEFPDGYGLFAWRGMPIPADLATELPSLTVDRIGRERNAEIRRVMLEHFGYERYLREAGARKISSDEIGTLWYLDLPGDEPLVMAEVVNSTPEPDGTSRVYWLRVPPRTRTPREGIAWTFGLTADEYHPLIQT